MSDNDEGLTPENLQRIVFAAVDPEAVFRRTAAKGLVREFHARFGDQGLVDILAAVDNEDRFASLIVLERNEVENYMYTQHGMFDPDIVAKVQMTERWDDFVLDTIEKSGFAAAEAVDEVIKNESG